MGYPDCRARGVPRTPGASPTGTCTRATSPASASTSTRQLAARFPYEPAYLPVARRRDGSMTDW